MTFPGAPRTVAALLPALAIAALLALSAGCPKRAAFKGPDNPAVALDLALATLEAGRHARAEEALNWVIFNFPGSREAADAQYWLAESHFRRHDYADARVEYEFYLRSFPNARYQEDANYKLGLSWLRSAPAGDRDLQPLSKAEEVLTDFVQIYPESSLKPEVEKALGEIQRRKTDRDLTVARLYYRAGEYRSALVYFRHVAETVPPARWEPADRLRLATCLVDGDERDEARELLTGLIADPDAIPFQAEASRLLARL